MKKIYQTLALSGANLLALSPNTGDAAVLKPHFSNPAESNPVQAMSDAEMRALEASHLEVYAACKWGHAAFDPIRVETEALSPEVSSLYAQMTAA